MGKRANFPRHDRDFYRTPRAAVLPLIPHLGGVRTFAEPCCGDGALVRRLQSFGLRCVYSGDSANGQDALARTSYGDIDAIITNPPYERSLMHALIAHFQNIAPTWLLISGIGCPGCNRMVIHCACERGERTTAAVKTLTPFALGELLEALAMLGEWKQGASLAEEQRKHLLLVTARGTAIVDVDRQDLKGIAEICRAAVSA